MSINIKSGYKIIFLVGLIFSFASVFLDWYYFQGVLDSGATITSWVYNVLFGWSTPFTEANAFNSHYQPQNATMPVVIAIILVIIIFLSAYSTLFHDVEKGDDLVKVKRFGFITLSLVTLVGFFCLGVPVVFSIAKRLILSFYGLLRLRIRTYFVLLPWSWILASSNFFRVYFSVYVV